MSTNTLVVLMNQILVFLLFKCIFIYYLWKKFLMTLHEWEGLTKGLRFLLGNSCIVTKNCL